MKVYLTNFVSDTKFDKEVSEIESICPDLILSLVSIEQWPEAWLEPLIKKIQPYLTSNPKSVFKIICIWAPEHIKIPNAIIVNSSGNIISAESYYNRQESFSKFYNPFSTKKLYTCYNRNPVTARAILVDLLAKNNLLSDGIVTFHHPEAVKDIWKYHDGSKLMDESDFVINPPQPYTGKIYYSDEIPKSYCDGFLDIICETEARPNYDDECYFISEKTYKAIWVGKPFIALQSHQFHKKYLRDFYGLELYDEIFDYSFDDEILLEKRILGIIENVKRLQTLCKTGEQKQKFYDLVKDKIEYNKSRILELANNPDFVIPEDIKFIVYNNDCEVYGELDKIAILKYMLSKGWIDNNNRLFDRIKM